MVAILQFRMTKLGQLVELRYAPVSSDSLSERSFDVAVHFSPTKCVADGDQGIA